MSEKNCGACGWWKRYKPDGHLGACSVPSPDCIAYVKKDLMVSNEGTSCPCWKERE